jgi:hypothetical protein
MFGFKMKRPPFEPEPAHVIFVVEKLALEQAFPPPPPNPSTAVSPRQYQSFHHCSSLFLHLHPTFNGRTTGQSLGTFKKLRAFRIGGEFDTKYFYFI